MARRRANIATAITALHLVLISSMVALLSSPLLTAAARTGMDSMKMERHETSSSGNEGGRGTVLLHNIAGRSSTIAIAPPAAEAFSGRQVPTGSDPIHHHRAPISHSP